MKVLYILGNYPQLSETYIQAEIEYALERGIEVHVWSQVCRHPFIVPPCQVHRGNFQQAFDAAKPDLLHIHYLHEGRPRLNGFPAHVPVTIRGHSFDWRRETCLDVLGDPRVRRVYLFPHFAATIPHAKVAPLPVAYSSKRYQSSAEKDRRMVFRTGAGIPTKGLRDFFQVAKLSPDHRFVMAISVAGGNEGFPDRLREMNAETGGRVEILIDVRWDEVQRLTARAGIYLDTSDPAGHAFGMPISIAESMATGSYVLARETPSSPDYVGKGGAVYRSVAEAADLVRDTLSWNDARWAVAGKAAEQQALRFRDQEVLPVLIEDWKTITGKP